MSLLDSALQSIDKEAAVGLLQELVRVNSVNPPGNEKAVAETIIKHLSPMSFRTNVC